MVMGTKALFPGKVTLRPCPGARGVRTGHWLLPPSSHTGLGTRYSESFERKGRIAEPLAGAVAGLHSQALLLGCPKHLQPLGTPQGDLLPTLLPTTGTTCQDLPDCCIS